MLYGFCSLCEYRRFPGAQSLVHMKKIAVENSELPTHISLRQMMVSFPVKKNGLY